MDFIPGDDDRTSGKSDEDALAESLGKIAYAVLFLGNLYLLYLLFSIVRW